MDATVDIHPTISKNDHHSVINPDDITKEGKKNRRGRPKGARTTRLSEVRRQAAEERKKIKHEMGGKIEDLKSELLALKTLYEQETTRLNNELELLKRRENSYQQALDERLSEVAEHLQGTLINWGKAELEEAQVDKRGRGRPRKTLK